MRTLADEASLSAFDPQWCLFWAGHVRPAQFAIWEPYLRRSGFRFVVMASRDLIHDKVREKVEALPRCAIVEPYAAASAWLRGTSGFLGFLYVGSNEDNAALMDTFHDLTHVWVGHGESAKKANAHRTASLYDSVFVGDYSAVRRYPRAIRRWVLDGACAIGVPVVDGLRADPWDRPRPIRTLVYAPTWEGHGPNADYTSLDVVGPALLAAMPALLDRGTSVLLRPHPGTGPRRPELKELLEELVGAGARRDMDKAGALTRADLLISDVSGVTSEFLFTRKPAMLPVTPRLLQLFKGERRLREEYPWVYRWDVARESLVDRLAAMERADPLREARAAAARRLFRDHRTVDDAVRTFDLALDVARRRSKRMPVRLAFEARRRLARFHRADATAGDERGEPGEPGAAASIPPDGS